jgi:hypothetical protein
VDAQPESTEAAQTLRYRAVGNSEYHGLANYAQVLSNVPRWADLTPAKQGRVFATLEGTVKQLLRVSGNGRANQDPTKDGSWYVTAVAIGRRDVVAIIRQLHA